jgi:hypothetical protein
MGSPTSIPFVVKDCALIAIATGLEARTLRELQNQLELVEASSIYFHFWGGLLRPGFEERQYHNDFAEWVRHDLYDGVLAERLAVIDPSDFNDLEELRRELMDIIGERLYESEVPAWSRSDRQFQFIRSQIIVFDTHVNLARPEDLAGSLAHFSTSSVFYHFIDARRRLPDKIDDFRSWLASWPGFSDLIAQLAEIDPYFVTLAELKNQLAAMIAAYFKEGEHEHTA